MAKIIKPTAKRVVPSEAYFEITGVNYNGQIHTYRLFDNLTQPMNQDKLAEFYETEKQKGNPLPMDSILHFSIMDAAVKSGNMELMNHIQKGLQEYPNTLSRVIYNSQGKKDEAIHNYGTQDAYSLVGDIVGPEGWIKDIDNKKSLELLTGIEDIRKLNKISQGINQTEMFLWRVNSKPSEKKERSVGFSAYDGSLLLSAFRNLSKVCPAFRVLQVN